MNIIKFRVWDSIDKRYLPQERLNSDGNGNIYFDATVDAGRLELIHLDAESDRYIVEPWAGITDIDGTDIYVGDVCLFARPGYLSEVSEVIFHAKKVSFEFKKAYNGRTALGGKYIQIRGNAHTITPAELEALSKEREVDWKALKSQNKLS